MAAAEESSHFDDVLGDALLPLVLAHLPLEDLCRLQRVCRRLRRAVLQAQPVWRQLYAATWPDSQASGDILGQQHQQQQRQQQLQEQRQQQQQLLHQQLQQQQDQQQRQQQGQGLSMASMPAHEASGPPFRTAPSGVRTSSQRPDGGSGGGVPACFTAVDGSSSNQSSSRHKRKRGTSELGAAGGDSPAHGTSQEVDWREKFKARFVEAAQRERLKRLARRHKAESALQVLQQEIHRVEQALAQEQRTLPALQAELAAVQRARQQASTAALAKTYWQPRSVATAHGVLTEQAPQDEEGREHDLRQQVGVSQLEVRKLQMALAAKRRRAAEARQKLQALLP